MTGLTVQAVNATGHIIIPCLETHHNGGGGQAIQGSPLYHMGGISHDHSTLHVKGYELWKGGGGGGGYHRTWNR